MENKSLHQFLEELQIKAARLSIPIYGGFELTSRCNLECRMCYVKGKCPQRELQKQELSADEWIKIASSAARNGALAVFLTGGEPLIREDFKEIYEAMCRLGLRITLFTNATLITEELVRWLAETPPSIVDVSLYGMSEDTYYDLCGWGEAYGRTINGIELLLKHGITTRLKTTIVKANLKEFPAIRDYAKSLNLEFTGTTLVHGNLTEGISYIENLRISPEQFYELCIETRDDYVNDKAVIKELSERQKGAPLMSCSAARTSFFVNWKGHLTPCPLLEKPFTEPLKTGYEAAWNELRRLIAGIPEADKCVNCENRGFCAVCPAKLYLETGRFDLHSEYLCKIAEVKRLFANSVCNM
ncbi:MAG TPA: radical SAM protein [Clostridiales bacterium]|jgi:MoaA/NifB/PqqE/SkfB family radical SAM enzyme|nr:radical SAM protein [Clostridiales bacterium]